MPITGLGADRVVHLEVDENSHADREVSCELTKVDETAWGVGTAGTQRSKIFFSF